jgi:hypothetical protein
MKILSYIYLSAAFIIHAQAGGIPKPVDMQVQSILNQLRADSVAKNYDADHFLEDLKKIDVTDDLTRKIGQSQDADPLKYEILKLALAVRRPSVLGTLNELKGWYGCYAHELSDELFEKRWGNLKKVGRFEGHRKFMRKQAGRSRTSGRVEQLRGEHLHTSYLPAWSFWLMAPQSKERGIMRNRITEAISKIGEDSMIPFLLEAMKNSEVGRTNKKQKISVTTNFVNIISELPGESALDALLVINRYAIENELNEENYYNSITRQIIRRLASRRAYADQLIDPKMKAVLERKGYNEKPEDIPLTDELWKKYKPLLKARLATKTEETPQADIDIIKSALEIMPKQ